MSKRGVKEEKKGKKGIYLQECTENDVFDAPGAPRVIGIDPGISGAIVVIDGKKLFKSYPMPLEKGAPPRSVSFQGLMDVFDEIRIAHGALHIFLERAVPMAMGSKGAFSYGRGFEAIVIAIKLHRLPVTMVEPAKWTREMHEGISSDLKPKARSLIAVQRLFPTLVSLLPQKPKGGLHDGPIDALLIAGYGLRRLMPSAPIPVPSTEVADFF